MKPAHEIILDETIIRSQREGAECRRAELVAQTRLPRGYAPFWYQVAMLPVLSGYFLYVSQPGDYRGLLVIFVVFAVFSVPCHILHLRKREKALLALVELEAPELYQKLQRDQIA